MAGILPIDPDKLADNTRNHEKLKLEIEVKETKQTKEEKPMSDIEEEREDDVEEPETKQDELFEKPKPGPKVEISKRTGKPKRKMNDKQLANLAKAQAASRKKRGAMKEAKAMEKTQKRLELETRKKEKVDKRLEEEAMIEYRRQIYLEESNKAKNDNTWDEERLTNLMAKTIGSYLDEKKRQKPKPREFIPNHSQQQYHQYPPTAPQNYSQQPPLFYQQQQHQHQQQQPQPHYAPQQRQSANQPSYLNKTKPKDNIMKDLFGYTGEGY